MKDYEYYKRALEHVQKPCAFVDLDALNNNMNAVTKTARKKKIRIASKSIRSVDMLKYILASSPIFQGVMCFTAEEAIFLMGKGLDDLLVAYPVWDTKSLRAVCNAVTRGTTIVVMVDSIEHVKHLEQIAQEEGARFLVCIDIDVSTKLYGIYFGVYRSAIKTVQDATELAAHIAESPYLTLDGVMGYEAQIAGVTDDDPTKKARNVIVRHLKKRAIKRIAKKRRDVVTALTKMHPSLRFVNGGGTGSLHQTTKEAIITEVTVGSGFFHSHLFDKYKSFTLEAAAGFALEITRQPTAHTYTCLGGGYVASRAVGTDKLPEIMFPIGAKLTENEGAGEVQTPIIYKGNQHLTYGDPVFFRHSKAGELCERFQTLYLIQNGHVLDEMLTYRGEGQCFL